MGGFTDRERQVRTLIEDQLMTFVQIADILGLSIQRVRQIYRRACLKQRWYGSFIDGISTAACKALVDNEVTTIEQALAMSDNELLDLRNFGPGMLLELRSACIEACPNWVGEGVPA